MQATAFKLAEIVPGETAILPAEMTMVYPSAARVPSRDKHYLVALPWHDYYLRRVPHPYRHFFQFVLPHLGARTTNVHTAVSVGMLDELIRTSGLIVNRRAVYFALILHDSGWSKMSEQEIADSLKTRALLHPKNHGAQEKHDVLGGQIARRVLAEYGFEPALRQDERELIVALVENHSRGALLDTAGVMLPEMQMVHDADRLWSYSHENFWQDTVRKGVPANTYLDTIDVAIPGYFASDAGRKMARALVAERRAEIEAISVADLLRQMLPQEKVPAMRARRATV